MKKIPTLFVRDPETNLRYVKNEVHPDCGWVIDGEGVPTRKYDGTCVLWDASLWWARREVKPGKPTPAGFRKIETDEVTGKTVGWEPAEASGFWKFLEEAAYAHHGGSYGTYELCGPKINGNPEGFATHRLVEHSATDVLDAAPRDFDGLALWLHAHTFEGIVWHHPDGRMAKLKRKDFPA